MNFKHFDLLASLSSMNISTIISNLGRKGENADLAIYINGICILYIVLRTISLAMNLIT